MQDGFPANTILVNKILFFKMNLSLYYFEPDYMPELTYLKHI